MISLNLSYVDLLYIVTMVIGVAAFGYGFAHSVCTSVVPKKYFALVFVPLIICCISCVILVLTRNSSDEFLSNTALAITIISILFFLMISSPILMRKKFILGEESAQKYRWVMTVFSFGISVILVCIGVIIILILALK